jgi:hypothetical protein
LNWWGSNVPNDEEFFAWLDGELAEDQSARVAAEVAADPRLRDLAASHRALEARLKAAFGTVAGAPVPHALRSMAGEPDDRSPVVQFRAKAPTAAWKMLPLAAMLAVGILVGTLVPNRAAGPVQVQGGAIYAAAPLGRALVTQLASAPHGVVRIGLNFRNRAGAICRSFTAPSSSGLACRESGRWALKGLLAARQGQASDYRMAAGMDPALAALIDSTMAGEPFDAAKERAAKASGWR